MSNIFKNITKTWNAIFYPRAGKILLTTNVIFTSRRKNMRKFISMLITLVIFVGCAAPAARSMSKNMNNISLGMSKAQVMDAMGEPSSVSAIDGTEYMSYILCSKTGTLMQDYRCVRWDDFYVRIKQGKVESYGRKGDFDSTRVPESKRTLDINVKQHQ